MEKMITVAGTSRKDGKVKFRFSNDLKGRIPMLKRTGHTEINLIELPEAMTKEDAVLHLRSVGIGLDIELDAKPAKPAKADVAVAPAVDAAEPTEAEIAERMEEMRESLIADGEEFSEELLREAARRELVAPAE
jgi:hypothetical protein